MHTSSFLSIFGERVVIRIIELTGVLGILGAVGCSLLAVLLLDEGQRHVHTCRHSRRGPDFRLALHLRRYLQAPEARNITNLGRTPFTPLHPSAKLWPKVDFILQTRMAVHH